MRVVVFVGLVMCAGCHGGPSRHAAKDGSVDASHPVDASGRDAMMPDAMPDAGTTPATEATSGSRLKIRWFQTPDGLRFRDGGDFVDSLRGEDCTVTPWAGGSYYCTPKHDPTQSDLLFSDNTCTTVIGNASGSYPYFADYVPSCAPGVSTETVTHLYRTGAALPAHTAAWMLDASNQCVCVPGADPTTCTSSFSPGYASGGEVGASDLVRVTRATEGSGSLEAYVDHGADGMTAPIPVAYDTLLATDCELSVSSGQGPCLPLSMTWAVQPPRSATCPLGTLDAEVTNGCSPAAYVGESSSPGVYSLYSFGTVDTGCSGPGFTAYHVGSQVFPQTIARGYETSSTHRLAPVALTSGSVDYHELGAAYDTEKAVECDFAQTAAGFYCLPRSGGEPLQSLYTDPSCTTSALLFDDDSNGGIPLPKYTTETKNGDLVTYAIDPAEHSGGLYVMNTECEFWTYDYPSFVKWHDVTVVPTSEFEPATVVVDP